MDTIFRHIAACNNAVLPGARLPLFTGGAPIGWLDPALMDAVLTLGAARHGDGVEIVPDRLQAIAAMLAEAGHFQWRNEAFDVRAMPGGPVLTVLDRGALPAFGVQAVGVHLNALVRRADGLFLWVARRAADKLLDPGKLDHLVAGGVPAGLSPMEALIKEAEEEAGLPAALLAGARQVAIIEYAMERTEGLRRDRLYCYDVEIPDGFVPEARDGEVAGFELWPMSDVVTRVRDTDDFKFNVNLVLINLFQRHGLITAG
jgi:8-oxo-dGTP pyrophosphatase MutT (NUDIX family)